YGSLMNTTLCATTQSSPMVTSSQTKLWDCTRVRAPIFTSFWISTNGPMKQSSPISQPYTFAGSTTVTLLPKRTSTMPMRLSLGSPIAHSQPAAARSEAQRHFAPGFDGFIDCHDELEAAPAFEAVDQLLLVVADAVDHVFVVGLVPEAVHVGR